MKKFNNLVFLLILFSASFGYTATTTTNLSVGSTVIANCKMVSTTGVSFGAYDPVNNNVTTPLDATGTLTVACTKNAPGVYVSLDLGLYETGSTRRMRTSSGLFMEYELYTTAARTVVWGTATPTNTVAYSSSSKANFVMTVYGRIPAGQDVTQATGYTDTVVATVNF